jgi:hypothetical protein
LRQAALNLKRIFRLPGLFCPFRSLCLFLPPRFFYPAANPELKNLKAEFTQSYLLFLAVMGIIFIQPLLQGYMAVQESILNHIPFKQAASS